MIPSIIVVYLPMYLRTVSIYLHIDLPTNQSTCHPINPPTYQSISRPTYPSYYLPPLWYLVSIYLSTHPPTSTYLSTYASTLTYLSTYASTYLPTSLPIHRITYPPTRHSWDKMSSRATNTWSLVTAPHVQSMQRIQATLVHSPLFLPDKMIITAASKSVYTAPK